MCYEALAQQLPFGGSRPLHMEFCPALPPNSPTRIRLGPNKAPSPLMWLSGPDSAMGHAVEVLSRVGLEASKSAVKVAGLVPGGRTLRALMMCIGGI